MDFICFDLINSQWYNRYRHMEPFEDKDWISRFLERWNFEGLTLPSSKELAALMALRTLLTHMVQDIQEEKSISKDILEELNGFISLSSVYREIQSKNGEYHITHRPTSLDWNWIISEMALSFAELICFHKLDCIKLCENPDCRFVFYDKSKNRTKRWCCDNCGNLMKVRRFRAKQKEK